MESHHITQITQQELLKNMTRQTKKEHQYVPSTLLFSMESNVWFVLKLINTLTWILKGVKIAVLVINLILSFTNVKNSHQSSIPLLKHKILFSMVNQSHITNTKYNKLKKQDLVHVPKTNHITLWTINVKYVNLQQNISTCWEESAHHVHKIQPITQQTMNANHQLEML